MTGLTTSALLVATGLLLIVVTKSSAPPFHVNGIFPSLAASAHSSPVRSQSGIGALMPWAGRLYMASYLTAPGAGDGAGLYMMYESFEMFKIKDHNSSFANRLLHRQSNQIIIGPWLIDVNGGIKTFLDLLYVRLAATAEHLTSPETMVYMLGMDGPLWECNITSLNCSQLFDLVVTLNISVSAEEQPIFKAAHTMNGRLVVTSATFDRNDFKGLQHGGRLAEWKGQGQDWTIIADTAFAEVTGRRNLGRVIYALGWDYRSVILKVFDGEETGKNPGLSGFLTYRQCPSRNIDRMRKEIRNFLHFQKYNYWQTYRLPKASHAYDHFHQVQWPRIREVETERYLMDMHGMFYELSPLGWTGSTWGVRPISQHLRVIPDFTSYRGFLVLGGNQVSSNYDSNVVTGQPQSGMWFGKTDDLWSFGKPQGWGAVWRQDTVYQGNASDPYLMTGFDKKVLHAVQHDQAGQVDMVVQMDFTGAAGHRSGERWVKVTTLTMYGAQEPYSYFIFPDGYSAHWVRLVISNCNGTALSPCNVTAYFTYT